MSVDPKVVLQRIESTYGPLPEGVPTVSYVYEPGVNGQCLYISPSIQRVLGYSQEEWMEDGGLWDLLLHPEDADRVIAAEAEYARAWARRSCRSTGSPAPTGASSGSATR